jgi:hypothetical protein
MPPFLIILYLVLCVILGLASRKTGLGFWGGFFFSVLATPVLGAIVVAILRMLKSRKNTKKSFYACPFAKAHAEMMAEQQAAHDGNTEAQA